jgi:uncharacterized spore protein YtfJ
VPLDQLLEKLLRELRDLSSSGSIVGKPLALGQTYLVPLSRITVGFGAGSAARQKQGEGGGAVPTGTLTGEGAGGAISVEPRAFVVVGPDGRPAMLTPRKGGQAVLSRGLAVHEEQPPAPALADDTGDAAPQPHPGGPKDNPGHGRGGGGEGRG